MTQYRLSVPTATELQRYWDGLITEEDRKKSLQFLNTVSFMRAIICPFCRTQVLTAGQDQIHCLYCGFRLLTTMSIAQIVGRIDELLYRHLHSGCADQCPQLTFWGQKLKIYCDSCPLNDFLW